MPRKTTDTMGQLPSEAERLLATAPEDFVRERGRVAQELRGAGRPEHANAVAALRKPSGVVLAVNRAARDRPQAARDAADAAERVRTTQLSGKPEAYRKATEDLERALGLLADVAVARLSRGKPASDATRRRVNELLRASVAEDEARKALVRGVLLEEQEASGFAAFEGLAVRPESGRRSAAGTSQRERRDEKRRAREKELHQELARAQKTLEVAQRSLDEATREHDRASKAVASIQTKLDRL
ncbi:MAG: hypothetical protein E6G11_13005 [Actinobacteria bacterium]|nr:MAG: hypothetical protein E6G28_07135 [Actinomycetota bacterium]TML48866.1 MAG: hypothetical protein E6G20_03960 [Actinomycetota bacterium]TML67406.1 MAG: hypothetical protein E6G11_13005 [Actinomycetota bacterium]